MDTPSTTEQTAGMGHNQPSAFEALKDRVDPLVDLGNAWNDVKEIAGEEQAKKADDVFARVKAEIKDVDAARLDATKPLREQTSTLNDQYNNQLKAPLEKIVGIMKPLLSKYLAEQERKRQAEEKRKADEAIEAMRVAEEAKRKAEEEARKEGGNAIEASLEADAAQESAEDAIEAAQAVHDTTVGVKGNYSARKTALRSNFTAEVTDHAKALAHCMNDPKIQEAVEQLAGAWARSPEQRKTPFPGVKLIETKTAA